MPPRKSKKSIGHYQKKGILPFSTHEIRTTVPENHFSKNNFPQASFCPKQIFDSSIREARSGRSVKWPWFETRWEISETKKILFRISNQSYNFPFINFFLKPLLLFFGQKQAFFRSLVWSPYGPYQTNDDGFHRI